MYADAHFHFVNTDLKRWIAGSGHVHDVSATPIDAVALLVASPSAFN